MKTEKFCQQTTLYTHYHYQIIQEKFHFYKQVK
jgi:hypothetical protein